MSALCRLLHYDMLMPLTLSVATHRDDLGHSPGQLDRQRQMLQPTHSTGHCEGAYMSMQHETRQQQTTGKHLSVTSRLGKHTRQTVTEVTATSGAAMGPTQISVTPSPQQHVLWSFKSVAHHVHHPNDSARGVDRQAWRARG